MLYLSSCQEDSPKSSIKPQLILQDESIKLRLSTYLEEAAKAEKSGQLDSAILSYSKVSNIYIQAEQWDSLYPIAYNAYRFASKMKEYTGTIRLMDTITITYPQKDTSWAKLAEIKALLHYKSDHIDASIDTYQKIMKIWERHPTSPQLLRAYNMLGIQYTKKGEYPLAESIYHSAITRSIKEKDSLSLRKQYFNLGRGKLAQEDWSKAIQYYHKGQQYVPHLDGFYESNLAEAYLKGNQPTLALKFAIQALEKKQNFTGRSKIHISEIHEVLAAAHLALGNYDQANRFFQQSLEESLNYFPPGHRAIGQSHISIGDSYFQQQLWNLALREYQSAIQIFLPGFQAASLNDCPSSDSLLSKEVWLMEALQNKGKTYIQKYKKSNKLEELKHAANHFMVAVQFINQIKLHYTESGAKSFLGNYSIPYIEEALQTQLLLFQETQESKYQKTAFELAQQATAFLLRESVNEQRAMQLADVPKDTIDLLHNLNAIISETQSAIANTSAQFEKDSLYQTVFQLKKQRLGVLERLESNYPKYFELKHSLKPIPLNQLQDKLDTNTLVIKYFLGQDYLYTFAFSKQSFYTFSQPIDTTFFQHITNFRKTLSDLDYIREQTQQAEEVFLVSSQYLYEQLIAPSHNAFQNEHLDRMLVIPDGLLNYLSFECLMSRPTNSWLNADAYLVHQYAIRYAYFAGLLMKDTQPISSTQNRFLGFGTEYNDKTLDRLEIIEQDTLSNTQVKDILRGKNLGELAFADDEVKEIASLLSGKAFLNSRATKTNFMKHTPHYEAIHVAAHSFIDTENDSTAYIVFNQDSNSEDFLLSLPEIYGLQLNANLIALSACQTGTGALQRSEGVMSLARAFQFAGSNSLIASQWSISDRASSLIMKDFYKALHNGASKDDALRQAKLRYLTDDAISSPAYRIPAYWGAIVLIGDDAPLEFKAVRFGRWWKVIIGGVLLSVIGWILYWRKRENL